MAQGNLSYQFKTADVITKVIVINALIFIVVSVFSALLRINDNAIVAWFVLPESLGNFITQPWSLITYSFIHLGFFHVLFNMLWLYFFGRHITNLFSEKRFLAIYLLGAMAGGVMYMISYNVFPAFSNVNGTLMGASGAVMATMAFAATYTPNSPVRIFTFNLKLWHIAVFLVVWDLVSLAGLKNAGGLIAHLGGAFFGYIYARQLLSGKDIGGWFEKWMDAISRYFSPSKKTPFKKVHRNKTTQSQTKRSTVKENKTDYQKKVDTILDKISKSGYESLTKAEKDFLFKAGKED